MRGRRPRMIEKLSRHFVAPSLQNNCYISGVYRCLGDCGILEPILNLPSLPLIFHCL